MVLIVASTGMLVKHPLEHSDFNEIDSIKTIDGCVLSQN